MVIEKSCTVKFLEESNWVFAFPILDVSIIDKTKEEVSAVTFLTISVGYIIGMEIKGKTEEEAAEKYFAKESFRIIWPYFIHETHEFLVKANYRPMALDFFENFKE